MISHFTGVMYYLTFSKFLELNFQHLGVFTVELLYWSSMTSSLVFVHIIVM